jgi:hypothetical protein
VGAVGPKAAALLHAANKRGAKVNELRLTPLELIVRIAALVPPPRTHRHRYFWVLAPNSPLRDAVTALATPVQQVTVQTEIAAAMPTVWRATTCAGCCVPLLAWALARLFCAYCWQRLDSHAL